MRPYIVVVLTALMLAYPVHAIPMSMEFIEEYQGYESVLTSDSILWGEDWESLAQKGIHILRPLDESHILVWISMGVGNGRESVLESKALVGFTQSGIDGSVGVEYTGEVEIGGVYRVLFEPHLPQQGMRQAMDELVKRGFVIDDGFQARTGSTMPAWITGTSLAENLAEIPGVLKIEAVLETGARNDVAASMLEDGTLSSHGLWNLGLNGDGIVIGVADSGLDSDHACFRQGEMEIGDVGGQHRKIQLINTTIDDRDDPDDFDYGHGTHIAGTLVCDWVDSGGTNPEATSPSYGARLLMQDIVGDEGWLPPDDAEWLFLEAAQNDVVIHSDSWGDDTTAYTKRSGDFDGWTREVPWSLIFVAPGNTGGQVLEPANARNVIAVGATSKVEGPSMLSSSSIGLTDIGTRGIFLVAPGQSILSAEADGIDDSMNGDTTIKSGTSMSTPVAASGAAVIQQLIEDGWISDGEGRNVVNSTLLDGSNISLLLADGFTPSGPLMKALLSMSTTSLVNTTHGGGALGFGPDEVQGWGLLNISKLMDVASIEALASSGSEINPGAGIWISDSYRMEGWSDLVSSRLNASQRPLDGLGENPWDGEGAMGPFISTGEEVRWNFSLDKESPLEVRLSWLAKPEPYPVDRLRLSVVLSDGRIAFGSDYSEDGWSSLWDDGEAIPLFDNETTTGISLNPDDILGVEWAHVIVEGEYVSTGTSPGTLGIEGDMVGFGVAVKGMDENTPVVMKGGSLTNISIDGVMGYQYYPDNGDDPQINMVFDDEVLEWNFETNPGSLTVILSVEAPHDLTISLGKSDLGFEQLMGAPIGIKLPRCVPIESVNPFLTSPREWTWDGVWWPPEIAGCGGNSVEFLLGVQSLQPPQALQEWEDWRKNITDEDGLVAIDVMLDLSGWQRPWAQGQSSPERAVCDYRFTHDEWMGCELFVNDWVMMSSNAYSLEVRVSWQENGGLEREFIITHQLSPFKAVEPSGLELSYSTGVVILTSDVIPQSGWPVALVSSDGERAYVEMVESEWKVSPKSCDEERGTYLLMTVETFDSADFNYFGQNHLLDTELLIIDGVSMEGEWEFTVQKFGDDHRLKMVDEERGLEVLVPIIAKHTVVLENECIENDTSAGLKILDGVFWAWLILTCALVASAYTGWRKRDDVGVEEE